MLAAVLEEGSAGTSEGYGGVSVMGSVSGIRVHVQQRSLGEKKEGKRRAVAGLGIWAYFNASGPD